MLKRILALVLMLSLLATAGAALASDVSAALYRGIIRITHSGNTTASAVSTNMTLDSPSFISSGFCNDNMTDIAIQVSGTDTAFMPGYGSNPWVIWVQTIGGNQNTEFDLYSSGATGGKYRYFPGPDGMTTADNTSLELGDNWTVEQRLYVDTTAVSDNLVLKDGAFWLTISASGNITAGPAGGNTWVTPAGHTANGWNDPENSWDDDTGTYAQYPIDGNSWSAFLQLSPSNPIFIDRIRYWCDSPTPTEITVIDVDYNSGGWNHLYQGAFTKGAWETRAIGSWQRVSELRIRLYNNNAGSRGGQIHEVDFGHAIEVTASGVSSGEHTAAVSANTTHLSIAIDGGVEDTSSLSANITNNSNNWTSMQGIDYMEYLQISINGTVQQRIEWQYSDIFTDLSGNGNHATPTFRTTSSDSDVSANLTSFEPVTQAQVEGFSLTTAISILTGIPSTPDNMYDELDFTNIPGAEAVNVMLDEGDTPYALWWFILIYMAAVILGFIAYEATRLGGGNGSLLTMFIVMEVIIALAGIMGPVPFWPAVLFPIAGTAIILSQKHFSWG